MSYNPEILECITRFLDEDDWNYKVDTQREVIKTGLSISGKMHHVDIIIDLRDNMYMVFFTCPLSANEPERAEMRDLLNRINYKLMFGSFDMDDRDGEIKFRMSVDCDGQLPSQDIIRNSFYRPAATIDKYGDAIVHVLMGFATGKEAFDRARNK